MNQRENGIQNNKAAFQQLLPLAQCSSKGSGITSKAEEGEGTTGQGWLERNADEESALSSYLSRVMSSFNQDFACMCTIYPKMTESIGKSHLFCVELSLPGPYPLPTGLIAFLSQGVWQGNCNKDYQHSCIDELQNPDV